MSNRALLLVNLGSPDAPDEKAVRRYLDQFLMDPFVIQLPWALRRLIVSLFVLPSRPKRSAAAYRKIWTEEGSPLIVLSLRLLEALRSRLDLPMAVAMRYGNPSIEGQLSKLAALPGVEEILLAPLYPHYAESTMRTCLEEARRVVLSQGMAVRLKVLKPFYEDPAYIQALLESARPWLEHKEDWDHLLFSYHGLPELHLTRADPTGSHCLKVADCCHQPSPAHATCYRHQVLRTTELFVRAAGLEDGSWSVAFQSRLGRAKWLEPSTQDSLLRLAAEGRRRVLVICPAFVTDCLETLEEIEMQNAEEFRAAGGESLRLIPCLNAHPTWADTLAGWIGDTPGRHFRPL